jgi:DNA-binding NtrC family response regulator
MASILYLDDDQALVTLVTRLLERAGHSVSAFSDAPAALREFAARPDEFDLVLTDMSMHGMSGLEFAQRALEADPAAAVVIASGCADPNWEQDARESGVFAVIEKPTEIQALVAAIERLVRSATQ